MTYQDDDEHVEHKSETLNWEICAGGVFRIHGIEPAIPHLPAGIWEPFSNQNGVFVKPVTFPDDTVVMDNSPAIETFLRDSEIFWANRDWYEQAGLAYKRGYLLHGVPGTGKTVLIRSLASRLVASGAIVLIGDELDVLGIVIESIHKTDPTCRIIVLFDDIDALIRHSEHELLSIMDGVNNNSDGVIWLGTTNYLEKIPDRLKNRPSRFDRVLEIGPPSDGTRYRYIESVLHGLSLPEGLTMDLLVQKATKLTFAQLKELVLGVCLFGEPVDEVTQRLTQAKS